MKSKHVPFVLVAALVSVTLLQCVSLKSRPAVVREPVAPGESTVVYEPPPPPRFSLDALRDAGELRKLITPTVEKVTDTVYLARGFALGSVIMIITNDGLVIIDTTESLESAAEIKKEFRKISDKPVKYIILTHSHLDHVRGIDVFREPGTKTIATKAFVSMSARDYGWLYPYVKASRMNQAGMSSREFSRELPIKSPLRGFDAEDKPIVPDIVFDQEYQFELGGRKFFLSHAQGETPDHLFVWLPDEKIAFPGDLFYFSFPNLSTPMLEPRPVKEWYESVDRINTLGAEHLVPCHSWTVHGAENIKTTLANYSKAIRFVYEATVEAINAGKSADEAVASIKLPDDLGKQPYLREFYGRVDWSVRGIYRQLTGWYDGRGTSLDPLPGKARARELIALAGGADKVLTRAIELQKNGEHQLAVELADVVIAANPNDKTARLVKASSLDYLGVENFNINMFGFYRSAAALERKATGVKP